MSEGSEGKREELAQLELAEKVMRSGGREQHEGTFWCLVVIRKKIAKRERERGMKRTNFRFCYCECLKTGQIVVFSCS